MVASPSLSSSIQIRLPILTVGTKPKSKVISSVVVTLTVVPELLCDLLSSPAVASSEPAVGNVLAGVGTLTVQAEFTGTSIS